MPRPHQTTAAFQEKAGPGHLAETCRCPAVDSQATSVGRAWLLEVLEAGPVSMKPLASPHHPLAVPDTCSPTGRQQPHLGPLPSLLQEQASSSVSPTTWPCLEQEAHYGLSSLPGHRGPSCLLGLVPQVTLRPGWARVRPRCLTRIGLWVVSVAVAVSCPQPFCLQVQKPSSLPRASCHRGHMLGHPGPPAATVLPASGSGVWSEDWAKQAGPVLYLWCGLFQKDTE